MARMRGSGCRIGLRFVFDHQPFEFGSQVQQVEWDMMTCASCREGNRDGIDPKVFPYLIPFLKSRGNEITLNARGRIDWPT